MQIHRLYSHTSAANAADYNDNRRKGSRDDSENPFPRLSPARVLYDVSSRERERESGIWQFSACNAFLTARSSEVYVEERARVCV